MTAVAAVPLSLVLARRPRAALIAAEVAAALCLAPWLLWVARHRADVDPALVAGYGTYTDLVAQAGWATLSPASIGDLLRPVGAVALAPFHGWLRFFLGVPALALVAAGFAPMLRQAPALGWTLLGYCVIVVVWPYGSDRFVWAVWPFLAVAFFAGAEQVMARAAAHAVGSIGRWCVAATVLVVVVGYGYYQVRGYLRGDATAAAAGDLRHDGRAAAVGARDHSAGRGGGGRGRGDAVAVRRPPRRAVLRVAVPRARRREPRPRLVAGMVRSGGGHPRVAERPGRRTPRRR